jgi:integrase/recombinase XerD
MLFTEATEKFLQNLYVSNKSQETIKGYRRELKYFKIFCEDKYSCSLQLEDVTDMHIKGYLQYKRDKNMASSSIARSLHILSSFYKFLCRKKLCSINPTLYVDSIKVNKTKREILTKQEFEKVLNNTNKALMRYIFITMYTSGLRVSELINLKLENVDFQSRLIHVFGIGTQLRDVPINNNLYNVLIKYLKVREGCSNYFFNTKRTGRVSAQYINRCLQEAVQKSKINKHISCQSLRQSFAANLFVNQIAAERC